MRILLVEGNPRSLIEQGYPAYAQYFEDCLATLDPSLSFAVATPFEAPLSAACLERIDGVVFTGSSTEFATDAAEYEPQRAVMEMVFEHGIPSWGSCAGLQLAAVVLGGTVGASPNGVEIGLAKDLVLTNAGQQHPMMRGRPGKKFAVPCIHRDEVRQLPRDAEVLAENDHSHVQAFVYNSTGVDFWGTQYHPELPTAAIAEGAQRLGYPPEFSQAIETADQDVDAAAQYGTCPSALQLSERALELSNWLMHVRAHINATAQHATQCARP